MTNTDFLYSACRIVRQHLDANAQVENGQVVYSHYLTKQCASRTRCTLSLAQAKQLVGDLS